VSAFGTGGGAELGSVLMLTGGGVSFNAAIFSPDVVLRLAHQSTAPVGLPTEVKGHPAADSFPVSRDYRS
jgi:hypothetical protein